MRFRFVFLVSLSMWRRLRFADIYVSCSHGGGGGERVLWRAVEVVFEVHRQKKIPMTCVIYTGDGVSRDEILQLALVSASLRTLSTSADVPFCFVCFPLCGHRNERKKTNFRIVLVLTCVDLATTCSLCSFDREYSSRIRRIRSLRCLVRVLAR